MATCNIIEGFYLDCKNGAAGIDKIYVAQLENVSSVTSSSGTTTAISMNSGKKFFPIECRPEVSEFKYTVSTSIENSAVSHDSTVEFIIYKVNAKNLNIMDLLVQNRLVVLVKFVDSTNTGVVLLGEARGGDVTAVEGGSGKANGDLNGLRLTISFKEPAKPTIYTGTIASIT